MNRVILMGRLVADPEFSVAQSGLPVCRFRIAVDRPVSRNHQNGGQQQDTADFFNISCFDRTAETVNRFFVKGKPVLLEGRIQNDNYTDRNGTQHYGARIIADRVEFLLSDPTRDNSGNGYGNGNYRNNNSYGGGYGSRNNQNGGSYRNNNRSNNNYSSNNYDDYQQPYDDNYDNFSGSDQRQQAAPQKSAPPAQQQPPQQQKDIQLGDSGLGDFEEIISDGDVPF